LPSAFSHEKLLLRLDFERGAASFEEMFENSFFTTSVCAEYEPKIDTDCIAKIDFLDRVILIIN